MPHRQIKLVLADVDGTLTDGGVYILEDGSQFKKFNAKDGMAFKLLKKAGYLTGLISASKSRKMVEERANMLKMDFCYVGDQDKLEVLTAWAHEHEISLDEVAFMGDDVNDLSIIREVGMSACPSDAVNEVKKLVHVVTQAPGGLGAFREWVDQYFL